MNEKAEGFLLSWTITNVHPSGPEGDVAEAQALAARCEREAAPQGIGRADLDAAADRDLVEHMRRALNIAEKAKQSA